MNDEYWLQYATSLIWAGIGKSAPNPAVAAVIVKDNKVCAVGVHTNAMPAHAEQIALAAFKESPDSATMYITLEPCNHIGKTPACSQAILNSGIKRVVYACNDENQLAAGGAAYLLKHGVECILHPMPKCQTIYQAFFNSILHKKSELTLKVAVDQLMNVADNDGRALKITSAEMHQKVANWRAFHDVILTSDNCILHDNPQMNARLAHATERKPIFILATRDIFQISQNIFNTCSEVHIFMPNGAILSDHDVATKANIHYFEGDFICWQDLLQHTSNLGYHRIWAEFGASTSRYLINNKIADNVLLLQGTTNFPESKHNLKDLSMPDYPVHNLYELANAEKILHLGMTEFPTLYLSQERICLPE